MSNYNKLLDIIIEIYIIILLLIFPLCVDSTGFFKILEFKYKTFTSINLIFICTIVIFLIYDIFFRKLEYIKRIKFSKVQIAVIIYWLVNTFSTFISPYFKKCNIFIGVGRGEGLINITFYCLIFLCISLFGKFKKRYLLYFSISSILESLICILQYIGFNPFHMYQDGIGTHNVSFIGTIGNVDFVSTFYVIVLTVSMASYIFIENKKIENFIHLLSVYFGFFIFEVLDVLSGAVGFICAFVIVTPFLIKTNVRLSKLLHVICAIILGYVTNLIINPVYHYSVSKLKLDFQFPVIAGILLCIIFIFCIQSNVLKKTNFNIIINKKRLIIYYLFMVLIIVFSLIVIYFINFEVGILNEVHEMLHGNFNDEFGTYRIFLWKRTIKLIREFPIFGTGPDTFAIRFMSKYTNDIKELGELTINDTAANNYLTMIINIGMIGLFSYITYLIFIIDKAIKNESVYSKVLLIALIGFLIQDMFNLWVVIVTPMIWVLSAILFLSIEKNKEV